MTGALRWCVAHGVHYILVHHIFIDPSVIVRYCAEAFVL